MPPGSGTAVGAADVYLVEEGNRTFWAWLGEPTTAVATVPWRAAGLSGGTKVALFCEEGWGCTTGTGVSWMIWGTAEEIV